MIELRDALHEAGAIAQANELVDRLPAAGMFKLFTEIRHPDMRYRYGQEPDNTPATPWGWDDLA